MDPEALSQINKLRSSLGLPLLGGASAESAIDWPKFKEHTASDNDEEPASTLETREAAGYGNFQKLQDDEKRRTEREQRKKAIQKARDAAARYQRLEGRGLGDANGDEQDTKSWLKGQKKRQKELERERTRKLEEELAERERQAGVEYTSSDLVGVQVAHEIGDFEDGVTEQILTLQDQEIGKGDDSDGGDVLESSDIVAQDKLQEKLDLKKKIRYDIHDDEEKDILSQYDEKKRKAFTLDGRGHSLEQREVKRQQIGEKLKNTISLDILKAEPISDYHQIKIRKPKKAKKKNLRQRDVEEDDEIFASTSTNANAMQIDEAPQVRSHQPKSIDTLVNDDEDLASALSFSRKAALKKKKVKAEDLVKQMQEEEDTLNKQENEGGMTLDDTTTFLDNLESRPRTEQPQPVHKSIEESTEENDPEPSNVDEAMIDSDRAYNIVENDEEALLDQLRKDQGAHTPEVPASTGLEEEKSLASGLGATLDLLRSRGLVKTMDDASDRNALYRDRQKFIIEARLREHDSEARARAQRERDRASGKMAGMSMREREEHARWANEQRAQHSSIQAAAAFNKEYKPDVQIKYVDDDGRLMNQKEAFKQLSHQFHGKGSGRQKTEKHMKKVADEKRREAKSVLDSSNDDRGMARAADTMGKRDKIAGVRLA